MSTKRLRVFAGPNGSGKTTLIQTLRNLIPFGTYVNADDIELSLRTKNFLDFNSFQINVNEHELHEFFQQSRFSPLKREEIDLWKKLSVHKNTLVAATEIDSYLAADLATFIRMKAIESSLSFTFETVMSHPGKIDFLHDALKRDYRVYLYFISTEDPEININRVDIRVKQKGHFVDQKSIKSRYYKSLEN